MNQILEKEKIENLIYEVRGKQVMLDSDLARLYRVETKRINEAVYRNKEKFPERFCFKLSDEESNDLLVANCDQKKERCGGRYKNPRVFTEQGVAMLATVLKSRIATNVSIAIMDAFVLMRKYISNNLIEQKYYKNMILRHDSEIKILQKSFQNFKEKNNHIFFENQIYDAYSLLVDIFSKSKTEIIIIDNYIDKKILDILSKTKKKIILITNRYNNEDYNAYKLQYKNVKMIINNKFHDRFIIIDRKVLYHYGASFKDLGNKCFAITKISDDGYLNKLLKNINIK